MTYRSESRLHGQGSGEVAFACGNVYARVSYGTIGATSFDTVAAAQQASATLNATAQERALTQARQIAQAFLDQRACEDTASIIRDIQVVQVLGRQLNDRQDLVAGKPTVIRVFLQKQVQPDSAKQKVVVKRNGSVVNTIPPLETQPTQELTFSCQALCDDWPAGTYSFEVTVDGTTRTIEGYQFQDRRPLRILAVPIRARYGSDVKSCGNRWEQQGWTFIRQVYPVSPDQFRWELGSELDLSAAKYDLNTTRGKYEVGRAVANLQPRKCGDNRTRPGCYDAIVGFIPESGPDYDGYSDWHLPFAIIAESPADMPSTVAHELGHVFGLGDEYDGGGGHFRCDVNPPPPDFAGCDVYNLPVLSSTDTFRCTGSTEIRSSKGSGVLVAANTSFPYEIGGRGPLPDMINFMGSGGTQQDNWVSPRVWALLFGVSFPPQRSAETLKLASRAAAQRFLFVAGAIPKDPAGQAELYPWYTFASDAPFTSSPGAYTVEAVDASGQVLVSQGFDVSFFALSDPPTGSATASFRTVLPFPDNTARFLVKQGSRVLAERTVSAHAPTVQVTAPQAGTSLAGATTITWNAQDADGDPLYFDVEYSPDGQEEHFRRLAAELTQPQWTGDTSTLPGGSQAVIRVWATDGVNTSSTTSGPFQVAAQPLKVFIQNPADGASYAAGTTVALQGSAYDPQTSDWLVSAKELAWTSDRDGDLGAGGLVYTNQLSPGQHTLTLKAQSPSGPAGQASVTIKVEGAGAVAPGTLAAGGLACGCGGGILLLAAALVLGLVVLTHSRRRPTEPAVQPYPSPTAPSPHPGPTPKPGTPLPGAASAYYPPATSTARLVVTQGRASTPHLDVPASGVLIGRDSSCGLVLHDPQVSRQHARLGWAGSAWVVHDLNSRNGTYINGGRITSQALRPGDQLQMGQTVLVFQG